MIDLYMVMHSRPRATLYAGEFTDDRTAARVEAARAAVDSL